MDPYDIVASLWAGELYPVFKVAKTQLQRADLDDGRVNNIV